MLQRIGRTVEQVGRRARVVANWLNLQRVRGVPEVSGRRPDDPTGRDHPNCIELHQPEGCRVFRATGATPGHAGLATTLELQRIPSGYAPFRASGADLGQMGPQMGPPSARRGWTVGEAVIAAPGPERGRADRSGCHSPAT